jgi:1-deoxy-D-xylulose-5-phosphate synthase
MIREGEGRGAPLLRDTAAGGGAGGGGAGAKGIHPTIADARFAKPLDRDLILTLARGTRR